MIDSQRPGNSILTHVQASNLRAQGSKCRPRASKGELRSFLAEVQGPETCTPPFVLDCQGLEARPQGSEPCKQAISPCERSSEAGVKRSEPCTPGFEPCGTVPPAKAPPTPHLARFGNRLLLKKLRHGKVVTAVLKCFTLRAAKQSFAPCLPAKQLPHANPPLLHCLGFWNWAN